MTTKQHLKCTYANLKSAVNNVINVYKWRYNEWRFQRLISRLEQQSNQNF